MAMTISDEERREVTARLRNQLAYMRLNAKWYEEEVDIEKCGNGAYRNIAASVEECGNMFSGNYVHIVELLADLIDRPTCKNLATKTADELFCSECGEHVDIAYVENADDYHARYCPNCGREIDNG